MLQNVEYNSRKESSCVYISYDLNTNGKNIYVYLVSFKSYQYIFDSFLFNILYIFGKFLFNILYAIEYFFFLECITFWF